METSCFLLLFVRTEKVLTVYFPDEYRFSDRRSPFFEGAFLGFIEYVTGVARCDCVKGIRRNNLTDLRRRKAACNPVKTLVVIQVKKYAELKAEPIRGMVATTTADMTPFIILVPSEMLIVTMNIRELMMGRR